MGWLYLNAQAESRHTLVSLPANADRLCRLYAVWQLLPADLAIPLTCLDWDHPYPAPPMLVDRLALLKLFPEYESRSFSAIATAVSLETVLEYVVARYGREQLRRLVQELDEHTSWQTLIPVVFGVSATEFEAGWQAYLTAQVGVSQ